MEIRVDVFGDPTGRWSKNNEGPSERLRLTLLDVKIPKTRLASFYHTHTPTLVEVDRGDGDRSVEASESLVTYIVHRVVNGLWRLPEKLCYQRLGACDGLDRKIM